jgi:hypothetical protein
LGLTAILDENALVDVISLIAGKRSVSLILVKANKEILGTLWRELHSDSCYSREWRLVDGVDVGERSPTKTVTGWEGVS